MLVCTTVVAEYNHYWYSYRKDAERVVGTLKPMLISATFTGHGYVLTMEMDIHNDNDGVENSHAKGENNETIGH